MRGAAFLALLFGAGCGPVVVFFDAQGAELRAFHSVTVADTPSARARGVIGRSALGADDAMLLRYPVVDEACITNAQVDFPLTAVFVRADGGVIASEALAAHDARVPCHGDTLTVVEVDEAGVPGASRAALP